MGELRRYQYKEVSRREKQYASSRFIRPILRSTVQCMQRVSKEAAVPRCRYAEVSQILRKTGVFVSGAFADGGEV